MGHQGNAKMPGDSPGGDSSKVYHSPKHNRNQGLDTNPEIDRKQDPGRPVRNEHDSDRGNGHGDPTRSSYYGD